MKINRKKVFGWLKIIIILYCVIGISLYYLQDKFLFHPQQLDADYVFHFKEPFEEFNIPINQEDTINLVKFFPRDSIRKGVVIYFHGNMKNVEYYSKFVSNFTSKGYELWMPDYPGYGKSTGRRTEEKMYAQALLVRKLAGNAYHEDSIILYGKSLGTGIAAYVASFTPCKELILETPYYSIPALFSAHTYIYPSSAMANYKIPTWKYLQDVKAPIYIFQGSDDGIIPFSIAASLKKYLKPGDKFIPIEKGSHNNLNDFDTYQKELAVLLK